MTSFSTAGGGVKATTYIQPGKEGENDFNAAFIEFHASAVPVAYTASAVQTVVDITGTGVLVFSCFENNSGGGTSSTVKITIDGLVVLDDTQARAINNTIMQQVGSIAITSYGPSVSSDQVYFNTSLKVECTSDVDSTYNYAYYLT